jgi:hypothetical protein
MHRRCDQSAAKQCCSVQVAKQATGKLRDHIKESISYSHLTKAEEGFGVVSIPLPVGVDSFFSDTR